MIKQALASKIDFSSNINSYQPERNINMTNDVFNRSSQESYNMLQETVAKKFALDLEQVALFASSSIHVLMEHLSKKNVVLYQPLHGKYKKAALANKKNIYAVNRITELEEEPKENAIVIFANPTAPDGVYEDLDALMKVWMDLNCTIILDENFLEYEQLKSYRSYVNEYKKLYILQSFSKFYSCMGTHIEAIFSHKKNIKKLQEKSSNISSLDAEFLKQTLTDTTFTTASKELYTKQKAQLLEILTESKLFDEIVESNINTILTYSTRAKEIRKQLKKDNIMVRKCGSFDYLSNDWLRFSVKDEVSQNKLKISLQSI